MLVREMVEKSPNKTIYIRERHSKRIAILKENGSINEDVLTFYGDTAHVYRITYDDFGNPIYSVDSI